MKFLFAISTIFIVAFYSSSVAAFPSKSPWSNVLQHGAAGDGETDDTQAFLSAWEEVCNSEEEAATLEIPMNRTFLLKHVRFLGPCKPTTVHVLLMGTIIAPKSMNEFENKRKDMWMQFSEINGLVIQGGGVINGNGWAWWHRCTSNCLRLTALHFHRCDGLILKNITHVDSPRNHISINACNNVKLSNLTIYAPEKSPNTDGVDISASTNVHIFDSLIATGDDCVAINTASYDINVTNVACGPGHGISVGSLGKDGAYETVERVHVKNCSFNGTQNGARIKTWEGGAGYAREIIFEDIILENARNPIIIEQKYVDMPIVPNHKISSVKVSNVTYRNFYGTSESHHHAIEFDCSRVFGCSNILVDRVNITSFDAEKEATVMCQNVEGKYNNSSPTIPCLTSSKID